jgi:hypothetical protein
LIGDLAKRLIDITAEVAQELDTKTPLATRRDWIDELLSADGDAIKTDGACEIFGLAADAVRERAVAAMIARKPVGFLLAGAWWIYSERRILDYIEVHHGLPARLAAQERAENLRKTRQLPALSAETPTATGKVASTRKAKA